MVRDVKFLQSLLQAYYDSPKYSIPQNAERAFQNDMKHRAEKAHPDTPENREMVLSQVRNGIVKEDIRGQDIPLEHGEEPIFLKRFDGSSLEIRPGKNAQSYNRPRRKIAGMKSWILHLKDKELKGEKVKYPSYYNRSLGKIVYEGDEYSITAKTKHMVDKSKGTSKQSPEAAQEDEEVSLEDEEESTGGLPEAAQEDEEVSLEDEEESTGGLPEAAQEDGGLSMEDDEESTGGLPEATQEDEEVSMDDDEESTGGLPEAAQEDDGLESMFKKTSFQIKKDGIYLIENDIERKIDELEDLSSQPSYIIKGLRAHPQVTIEEDEDGIFAEFQESNESLKVGVTEEFQEELLKESEPNKPNGDDSLTKLQSQFASLEDDAIDPFAFDDDDEELLGASGASKEEPKEDADLSLDDDEEPEPEPESTGASGASKEEPKEDADLSLDDYEEPEPEPESTGASGASRFEFYEKPSPINPSKMEYFIKTINEEDEPAFQSVEDFTLDIDEFVDEDDSFRKVTDAKVIQQQQELIDESLENED